MDKLIQKVISESKIAEVDSSNYDSVEVDLKGIESDIKKGNYDSFTSALDTLHDGKSLVVRKLVSVYPTIKKGTKNPLEVKALSLIEDSFVGNKISKAEKTGTFDSVLGYWHFDTTPKKHKWVRVEKVKFDELSTAENKKTHVILDLSDSASLVTKDSVIFRGLRKFAKGSAFTDISKWKTLKDSKLLDNLDRARSILKMGLTRSMNDLYSTLSNPTESKKSAGTRKDFDSIGESAYTSLAKLYNRISKTEGGDEKTAGYAPEVMQLLKETMETLQPLVTSRTETKYKKVWLKSK